MCFPTGNFILKNGTLSIWTTFDNPTDTILPGQNFTLDHILRSGLYSFRLLNSGEIRLQWNDSVTYYTSPGINTTSNLNLTSPSLVMQEVGVFSLSDPFLSTQVIMARSSDYGEAGILRFVRLDSDGNVRIYSSATGSGKGSEAAVRWTAVSDQCQVFGYCGNFGVCRYSDVSFSPVCGCPSGNFDPVDPSDGRKGCKSKLNLQDCNTTMLPLNNTMFLAYPPEIYSETYTSSVTACRSNCFNDATCVASTSLADGTGLCYMKHSDFVGAHQSPTVTSTSFIKVCDPALPNPIASSQFNEKTENLLKIGLLVLGCAFALVVIAGVFSWLYCWPKMRYESSVSVSDYASSVPVQFSYKELQKATKGFKEKLGEGGFGSVYRGVISDKMVVAVKTLEGIGQGEKQFRMEVMTISSTHHLNLVRLAGFCSERRHRMLVYEFMKNGSLDSFLFNSLQKNVLNWERRYGIALGAAKGITYLHEECRDCILHADIKPENILLDEDYNVKISDFGLARLLNLKDHRHQSLIAVRGTRGYLAPEWLANMPITTKADVFSYGMVLLEIVSGKKNFEVSAETDGKRFSFWAYEEFEKGNVGGILDKRLDLHEVDVEEVIRAVQVSFWCIQEHTSRRPTMGKVVQMLEGIVDIPKPPAPVAVTEGFSQPAAVILPVSNSRTVQQLQELNSLES